MIKQNVFIINFNSLYEILDEIKENLSFNIIKHENEENFNIDKIFEKNNSLIIINSSMILSLKSSIIRVFLFITWIIINIILYD